MRISDWSSDVCSSDLDMDGDGIDDVVTTWVTRAKQVEPGTAVSLAEGDGTFAPPIHHRSSPYRATLADVDGDDDVDVINGSVGYGLEVLLNTDGDLADTEGVTVPYRFSAGSTYLYSPMVGDLDEAGRLDVV